MANLGYRPAGLALLRDGLPPIQVLAELTAGDDDQAHRQAGIVGASGPGATYTGSACFAWAGGLAGEDSSGAGFAIQGNILAGPQVVEAMHRSFLATDPSAPLADRLYASLLAGDRAGGDRRGRQSAALLVVTPGGGYGGGSDVLIDLRVDDHPDPVTEIERLLRLYDLYFHRPEPADCLPLVGELAAEVTGRLARAGHAVGTSGLDGALADWAGIENLEERLLPGVIDPVVLDYLRAQGVSA